MFVKPWDIYVGGLYGRESSRSRAPGETKSCLTLHINKYTFTRGTYTNHCWKSFLNMLFKILHQININIDINVNTNHLRIPGHNKESTFVSRMWTIGSKARKTICILLGWAVTTFMKTGTGTGMEIGELHSQNSGMGRDWKNSPKSGTGTEWKMRISEILKRKRELFFVGMAFIPRNDQEQEFPLTPASYRGDSQNQIK